MSGRTETDRIRMAVAAADLEALVDHTGPRRRKREVMRRGSNWESIVLAGILGRARLLIAFGSAQPPGPVLVQSPAV